MFALALASCIITVLAQNQSSAIAPLEVYPLKVRICNVMLAYAAYLGKMVWPRNLGIFYPHPGASVPVPQAFAAGVLLVILTGLVLGPGRHWPYLAVGWLWYLGTLVPVIGLVQVGLQAMADRYTYVPLIGLFLLLTWGMSDLAAAWRLPRFSLVAAAVVVLCACGALTRIQLGYWGSEPDFWRHALSVAENNGTAHNGLGVYFYRHGRMDDAQKEFEKAVAIDPVNPTFHLNHGLALSDLELRGQALVEYQKALDLDPGNALTHTALGNLLRDIERREEALAEYQKAVELRPDRAAPHVGLGNVLADLGRREEAIAEYRLAVQLEPRLADAHNSLAVALQVDGRLEEALTEYRRAAALGFPAAEDRIQACERLRALRRSLADLLAGQRQPANNAERLELAEFCGQPFEGLYARAAQLYADAFRADRGLANDPRAADYRINAAFAAVQAGCGQGHDAAALDDGERARLRAQGLSWLQAELALWRGPAEGGTAQDRVAARQALSVWQHHPAFIGVRDPVAVAKLPEAEREAWRKLWQDVEAVRARAGAPEPNGRRL